MSIVNRFHTAYLAEHLSAEGAHIVDHGVETPAGLLAVVMADSEGWIFGHLRVAEQTQGFTPPIGAYSDEARYRVRKQATAWFNDRGLIPDPGDPIRVDAFGVLLDDQGAPATVHHVPSAY